MRLAERGRIGELQKRNLNWLQPLLLKSYIIGLSPTPASILISQSITKSLDQSSSLSKIFEMLAGLHCKNLEAETVADCCPNFSIGWRYHREGQLLGATLSSFLIYVRGNCFVCPHILIMEDKHYSVICLRYILH